MERLDSNFNSTYLFAQPGMSSSSSPSSLIMDKGELIRSNKKCHRVKLYSGGGLLGFFFGILLTVIALGAIAYFCGMIKQYMDLESCYDVNMNKSTILKLENVSTSMGVEVDVECRVVNYGFSNIQTQKVYWTGPGFEAEAGPRAETKIIKGPSGVSVIGKEINETYQCSDFLPRNGTVIVPILIFTLTIIPTEAHQGWYTCSTNYTVAAGHQFFGAHVSSESFHLSIY